MKIVSLVWFKIFPAKYGGQKGIAIFEEKLAKHFEMTCICSNDNEIDQNSPLKILPVIPAGKLQFINVFAWIEILKAIKEEKADILLLEHPYHALLALIAKRFYGMKLVLHEHNIEFLRFRNIGKNWWPILKWIEKTGSKESDHIFYKTEQDRQHAIRTFKLNAAKTFVIPYGIEPHEMGHSAKEMICEKHNIPARHKLILFAGTLDYEPNAKAVQNIYKEIAPRLLRENFSFTILICGRNKFQSFDYLNNLKHSNVLMVGEVDRIEDYFMAADVFINPVAEDNGVQTKNLEALSYHLNLVCFENTLTGIDQEQLDGKVFSIEMEDWNQFAVKTKIACETENVPTPVSFFKNYGWDSIAEKSANILCQLNKK